MLGAARILSLCLMLGLVLPVCLKAFAPAASAATASEISQSDVPETPAKAPCATCCGGWKGMLSTFVVPEPRRNELAIVAVKDRKPLAQVSAAFVAQGPPPEWHLALALPHSYSTMHARTDRLLL